MNDVLHYDPIGTIGRRGARVCLAVALICSLAVVLPVLRVEIPRVNQFVQSTQGTLATAPASLRDAVNSQMEKAPHQLGASYSASGVELHGSGFVLQVGRGSVSRGSSLDLVTAKLERHTDAATYGVGNVTESFHSTSSGIEQTIHVARRPEGNQRLSVRVPLTGLVAEGSGAAINLRDRAGAVVADYSDLRVTDAKGRSFPATMVATLGGSAIAIRVNDRAAKYPLTIDPTWSSVSWDGISEPSWFGMSVAISGSTAVIGAPGGYGAAYVLTESSLGGWSEVADLTASDGYLNQRFGISVAISGSTIAVGASNEAYGYAGAVYVFTGSGSSWTQQAELTASDETADDAFGGQLVLSGSTLAVGAANKNSSEGSVYIFSGSGSSWTQETEFSTGDAGAYLGLSLAISGSTIFAGAPHQTVGGVDDVGAAYVLTESGSSWSEAAEIDGSDTEEYLYFGGSLSVSGSSLAVGSGGSTDLGQVFIYSGSGSSWAQSSELDQSLPSGNGQDWGRDVALSGSTLVVSADLYGGSHAYQGAAYIYTLNGSTWTQTNLLVPPGDTANYQFGGAMVMSGSLLLVGASHYGYSDGAAYFVTPIGGAAPAATATAIGMASRHQPNCHRGDPVNCASGDYYDTVTDASIPGYGPNLDLTRTYNSLEASIEGPFGYGWSSSYSANLEANSDGSVTIAEADGSQVTATPDGLGGFVVPPWADSTLSQSGSTYTFVRQGTGTYTFDSSGQLTSLSDPNGDTTTLAYTSGKLSTLTDPSGRTLTFAYGTNGLVSSVTDPMSRATTYGYDSYGNLTSVTDPLSRTTSYTYDTNHLLLTDTDPRGGVLTNTYDSSGRVLTQTDPMGRETTFAYTGDNFSDTGGTTTVTDPDSNVETEDYTDGEMTSKTVGSSTWTYTYDPNTFGATTITDPNSHTTTNSYDTDGNLVSTTNADGNVRTYAYNTYNEQTCATAPEAASACSSLSPPAAITAGTATITPPSSAPPAGVTYTEYDTNGNEIYQTTGDYAPGASSASQSRTTYDLYNGQSITLGSNDDSCSNTAPSGELPCATISADGVVTQLNYDSAGDLTSSSTPDGNSDSEVATTSHTYDDDGEQIGTVVPDGNLSGANAGNYTTSIAYNADGEKTSVSTGGGSGHTVVPRVTTYAYDADGNETSVSQNASPELIGTTSGSNASSSLTLNLPKGTLAGDVVVLSTTTSPSSGSETVSTPSGYTLVDSSNTGQTTTYAYTHVASAGDTDVTLTYSTSDAKVATLAVYSGVNASSPVDTFDDATTSSGTSVGAASLSAADAGEKLVFVGGAGQQGSSATWSAPSSMASKVQVQLSGVSALLAQGMGPASGGPTGTETATTTVSGQLAAIFLALSPGSVTSSTAYDADNGATVATDPDGNATLTCYDGDGHAVETVPPVGVATDSLTASSCPTSYPSDYGDRLATDATTTAYDALGDKTTVTTPAPAGLSGYETTTYAYDPAGNLTSVTAPPTSNTGGAPDDVTDYTYDAADQLLTTTTGAGTGTAATTSNCYDPDGDKTATVPGDGNTSGVATCSTSSPYQTSSSYQTAYSYDSLGELVTKTAPATSAAPSGEVTAYTYDPVGNKLTSEDPNGVTTTNTFTPLNQVATVSYSDSTHDVSDTYDADGNRTAMTDASGTSSYSYDPFGELTSAENGASKTVGYTYDALGDTTSITYPLGDGATWANTDIISYGYDPASELSSVTDFNGQTSPITNTPDGVPSELTLGSSGDEVNTTYAANDAPSDVTLTNGSTLQEFSYSDVPSGGASSETDAPSSALSPAVYSYDAQSRVTSMTPGSGSALSYGEDASSNLTTLPSGAGGTYNDASQLISSSLSGTTTDYTYDASGNRTEQSVGGTTTVSAAYNGAEQLTSYSNSAADMTTATYDGDGLRTSAASTPTGGNSSTQNFVWDTTEFVPRLLMDSTNAYVYGPSGTPFEQVNLSTGVVSYLVPDALGSVRGVVSSTGSLAASTPYDAWGNPETAGGLSSNTPFGFAGGYTDPSGLIYLIGRYYDPATGQFLNVDPEVDATGQPYAYTGDNPVNASDPFGLRVMGNNVNCNAEPNITPQADMGCYLSSPWVNRSPVSTSQALEALGALILGEAAVPGIEEEGGIEGAICPLTSGPLGAEAVTGIEDLRGVQQVLSGLSSGRDPGVWTVPSEGDLQQLYEDLTENGTPTTWKNYSGQVEELPDGTQIGIRSISRSGGSTIDIRSPSGADQWKVHIG